MAMSVFVVGSSNTDMVVKAHKLPAPGETVMGDLFLMNPGGKGANQAVAAARLSEPGSPAIRFVAKVGNDVFGHQAVEQFRQEGIDSTHVLTDPQHPSGVALINVDAKGENCIAVAPGANHQLRPAEVLDALEQAPAGSLLLLQLESPLPTVEAAVRAGRERGLRVVLNPAPAQLLPADLLAQLFMITPNESEAELLTGMRVTDMASAHRAATYLQQAGVANVVITLGSKGAYLLEADATEGQLIAAAPVTALDTTAAGDCFNGALVVALAEASPLPDAVAFACRAAAISVTRMGAQASLPYRKELNELPLTL
ncbi:ribokinase [Spirosoma montaniterrae]|uniref:Ribokinase n=1 Tax=Spirosoma montaniterrae TaxID=1178516 RepID=A0A1P9WX46_9BACT|nr:ribokinase [Spirosoma montaniterrae]AQG79954.1 ribokinase [Spirosoma montaniterrae]